ncbi:hypothetical protein [uncultured Shimia sp.]|uniref:hypothetical protein n=1 Tax=uncultured Shimia sp. TaxID=573152 RepID=UPI0026324DED|nr:hypothetical protein [uncultured Shimia sp.]
MKYDWILDVLADLKTFAHANDLRVLADQLEETRQIAAIEIVSVSDMTGLVAHGDDTSTGTYSGNARERARA